MSTMTKRNSASLIFTVVATVLLFFIFILVLSVNTSASLENDLRHKSSQLEQAIVANEAYLVELREQGNTLKAKIDQLRIEINNETNRIELTQTKIAQFELKIEQTQKELEKQKDLLRHAIVVLYKDGNISTIEMLASSDSYTDFINQQEYLSRIKDRVHESANEVKQLKVELEAEKQVQDDLLVKLEIQRSILNSKESEQRRVLEITQGEEARYQAMTRDLRAQKAAAEAELAAYLRSLLGNAASLGPVSQGQVVGLLGNTGYSTGPHLSFKIYTADTVVFGVNPVALINNNGWTWPVSGGGIITQPWGCTSWAGRFVYPWSSVHGCHFHDAVDIAAPEGTPLLAIADGDIIHRGCLFVGTIFSNFMVIIDHGNGFYSSYAHMVAPDDPAFNACRANTFPW